jgi:dTDP-4-dehydrorhamnose reductase
VERRRIVVVGAGGRLGAALGRAYHAEHDVVGFNHAQLDLGAPEQLRTTLEPLAFDLLINCAALTNVDGCETDRAAAFALNAEAPALLAEICSAKRAKLIQISTDYVFDGEKRVPYSEADPAEPISVYGASKLEGERRVLATSAQHLVARVSWVFGADRPSFIDWVIGRAREHDHVEAIDDKLSTPTYTLDIAEMLRESFNSGDATGVLHLANLGECSWREYGEFALERCRAEGLSLRTHRVHPISLADMKNFVARRPIYTVLSTAKYEELTGKRPRHWRDAVADYVRRYVAREQAY